MLMFAVAYSLLQRTSEYVFMVQDGTGHTPYFALDRVVWRPLFCERLVG
jgi:hypothetical protein